MLYCWIYQKRIIYVKDYCITWRLHEVTVFHIKLTYLSINHDYIHNSFKLFLLAYPFRKVLNSPKMHTSGFK